MHVVAGENFNFLPKNSFTIRVRFLWGPFHPFYVNVFIHW
jgi:hypothetical protein